MKKTVYWVGVIGGLIVVNSCSKELDIKYKDIEPIRVIEGSLTQYGANVRITITTPMNEPMNNTPITDAVVCLTDVSLGVKETLMLDQQGNYIGKSGGICGHLYELTVEKGTAVYKSSGKMPMPTDIIGLEFNWVRMPYDHVAVLQVTFVDNDPEGYGYYWIRLYRNGEAYMWNVVSDQYASKGVINDVFMTSRKDLDKEDDATALREGDIVSVSVTPISHEMCDYLEAVSSDSNGPILFSGDFCLGYFLVGPVAERAIVFSPDSIPEY